MVMGAFIVGFSSILTGVNFIVTIHKLRAPGITWSRLPLFLWAIYATCIIQVLATPVLAITLLLLMLERSLGIGIFDPHKGGDPVLFQHFFWFYSHPAVYIMILPGMGIVNELIATFTHRKIFGISRGLRELARARALLVPRVGRTTCSSRVMSEYANDGLLGADLPRRDPVGREGLQLDGDALQERRSRLASPMLYALAFLFQFTHRRPHRALPRR